MPTFPASAIRTGHLISSMLTKAILRALPGCFLSPFHSWDMSFTEYLRPLSLGPVHPRFTAAKLSEPQRTEKIGQGFCVLDLWHELWCLGVGVLGRLFALDLVFQAVASLLLR